MFKKEEKSTFSKDWGLGDAFLRCDWKKTSSVG